MSEQLMEKCTEVLREVTRLVNSSTLGSSVASSPLASPNASSLPSSNASSLPSPNASSLPSSNASSLASSNISPSVVSSQAFTASQIISEQRRLFGFNSLSVNNNSPSTRRRQKSNIKEKKVKEKTWTKTFVCMSQTDVTKMPTQTVYQILKKADLGEKKITLLASDSALNVDKKLKEAYPKLEMAGGYILARGGITRQLVHLDPPYSVARLKESVSQGKLFIIPMQQELDESPLNSKGEEELENDALELCHNCKNLFFMYELFNHLKTCRVESKDQSPEGAPEKEGKSCETVGASYEEVIPESPEAADGSTMEVVLGNPLGEILDIPFTDIELLGSSCELDVQDDEVNGESSEPVGNRPFEDTELVHSHEVEGEMLIAVQADEVNGETSEPVGDRPSEDTEPVHSHEVEGEMLIAVQADEVNGETSEPVGDRPSEDTERAQSYELTVQAIQSIRRSHPDTSSVTFDELIREVIVYCQKNELEFSPIEILRKLQSVVVQGRCLEIDPQNQSHYAGGGPCSTSQIFVDRENILKTGMEEVKTIENLRLTLEVVFYGEMADDFGGPRKEFFSSILREIYEFYFKNGLKEHLASDYLTVGVIFGLSILQNGKMPTFLEEIHLQQIFGSASTHICLQNIREGLEKLGIYQIAKAFPSFLHLFRKNDSHFLTIRQLQYFLKPKFSPVGSNARTFEASIYSDFIQYLRDVAGGRRDNINLGKILQFFTGVDEEPPLGFVNKPSLEFVEACQSFLPTSSTCANILYLPRPSPQFEKPPHDLLFRLYDYAFANSYFGMV